MLRILAVLPFLWSVHTVCRAQQPQTRSGELHTLLSAIDSNNTTLNALRLDLEAGKMGNRIGLNPEDPKVGINYLRPNPRLSDRRLDFEISQELEFPTVYGHRRKVARQQDHALDAAYALQRRDLLNEAVLAWLQWIYRQQYRSLLQLQNDHASQISDSYQRAFDAGQINVLERNKARIHAINSQKKFDFNEIELQSAYDRLVTLNGGKPLPVLGGGSSQGGHSDFPAWELPANADQWLSQIQGQSLLVNGLETELEVARTEEKLAGAMQLPNLEIGFMREQDIEVDFRGITLGVSVPLWQHRNRRRHAHLNTTVRESQLYDGRQQFELRQRALFRKAEALKTQLEELRAVLDDSKGPDLLRRALDLGEITLIDYLVEQSMYYELMESVLQTELAYRVTQAEMRNGLDLGVEFVQ